MAGPGDTIAEAFSAHLGEQQGTLDAYNDVEYYNFTAIKFQYYNFTLFPDPANYNTIGIFDSNYNLIKNNVSGAGAKSIVLIGYEHYIIAIYGSEFMEKIPGNYSLIINETEFEVTPGPSELVNEGSHESTLELYNSIDWYNFSGAADKEYQFKVTYVANDSYTGLYVYDSDLHVLEWNWMIGSGNTINRTGNTYYLIAVVSSEFAILPLNYTLTITDITPNKVSSSTTVTSESVSSSSSTDQVSSTTSNPTSSTSSPLPLNWLSVIYTILLIPLITRKNFIKK